MSDSIWDGYANWSTVAAQESTAELKHLITGLSHWGPNQASPTVAMALEILVATHRDYGTQACALDFGCGLGRNAPLLRQFFPKVVGVDMPEMIARLKTAEMQDALAAYDAVHDDLDRALREHPVHVVYDSVVFQHIIDPAYNAAIAARLLQEPTVATIVSLKHIGIAESGTERLLRAAGWSAAFEETESLSFPNSPHIVTILRRP